MPILLITGPFLPDLIVVFFSLIFIYLAIFKKIEIKKSIFTYFFIFFFSVILLSTLFSLYKGNFLSGGYLFYFRFPLFSLIIFLTICKYPKITYHLFWILSLIIALLFIDSLKEYYTGYNLINYKRLVGNRVTSFFGEEAILGKYIFIILPLFIYSYFDNSSKIKAYYFYLLFFLSFIIILISGNRSSLILTLFLIIIFILFFSKLNIKNILIFSILIFSSSMIIYFDQDIYDRLIIHTFNTINIFADPSNYSINLKFYVDMFNVSIEIFKENYLIGSGPKTFRILCENYIHIYTNGCSTHPHNIYLELLSETGIFLFLSLISLWILISYILVKNLYKKIILKRDINNKFIVLLSYYFLAIMPFLPTNSFFNNWHNVMLYLPLGFLLYEIYRSNSLNYKIFGIKIIDINFKT